MIIIKLQPSPFDKVVEYPQNRAIPQSALGLSHKPGTAGGQPDLWRLSAVALAWFDDCMTMPGTKHYTSPAELGYEQVAETEACEKLSTQFHRPVRNGQSQVTVSVPQVHISSPQNTLFTEKSGYNILPKHFSNAVVGLPNASYWLSVVVDEEDTMDMPVGHRPLEDASRGAWLMTRMMRPTSNIPQDGLFHSKLRRLRDATIKNLTTPMTGPAQINLAQQFFFVSEKVLTLMRWPEDRDNGSAMTPCHSWMCHGVEIYYPIPFKETGEQDTNYHSWLEEKPYYPSPSCLRRKQDEISNERRHRMKTLESSLGLIWRLLEGADDVTTAAVLSQYCCSSWTGYKLIACRCWIKIQLMRSLSSSELEDGIQDCIQLL
ncbi:uncharacterized protein BO96DRAFT_330038 [Aspergillus niger CBS 101883]|uniref:Uncharacterized protein n=3 Tax=Aspergillus niger TaxID=5061 RepID=A2R1Y2_ASPNC|nr:uncharacterized protein BO96DRAFT_330038 [Aspergillus niger CBS 101883]XP_059602142.1 hypothetical protein An13g02860 [Aspergillus niger]PYH59996.1 hypothetical protein BO96DRAFT_330038 [Aspergillus niger CBS 101883]RDH24357.1 hypothetical protein M747DRAFT_230083 [Aspergillus niger ATCC 13496]CAK41682.1 hypothetical protein An13g02860 [Aspergillus niger]